MKLEIVKILDYFFDLQQDAFLTNLKNQFVTLVCDEHRSELLDKNMNDPKDQESIELFLTKPEIKNKVMSSIIPKIYKTGTEYDHEDKS